MAMKLFGNLPLSSAKPKSMLSISMLSWRVFTRVRTILTSWSTRHFFSSLPLPWRQSRQTTLMWVSAASMIYVRCSRMPVLHAKQYLGVTTSVLYASSLTSRRTASVASRFLVDNPCGQRTSDLIAVTKRFASSASCWEKWLMWPHSLGLPCFI